VGTSHSPLELAAKFERMREGLLAADKKGVAAGAALVAASTRAQLSAATKGTNRLRGVGKAGARLSVRTIPETGVDPAVLVQAVGPWQIIEGDTQPHTILPRGVGRARGRSRAARHAAKQQLYEALFGGGGFAGVTPLAMPWGPRFRALHPGTTGKHPWKTGVEQVEPKILPVIQAETHAAMVRAFR